METELLATGVTEAGLGLVNFDGALWLYKAPLLRLMALDVGPLPVCSDLLRISERQHYVNRTLPPGSLVRLKRLVSFADVRGAGRHVSEIAQYNLGKDQLIAARHNVPATRYEPGQFPAVLAAACGAGRFVQFTSSPRLWHPEFYGHGMGLDALFWRGIAWAARKPFVALMMPPYATLRVDDAIGRHDLRYVQVMNDHGFHPLISCFLRELPDEVTPFMRAAHERGMVDWDAHALDYYNLIPFRFGVGEYSDSELADIFDYVDQWYAQRGFGPPKTAYFHWGEIGLKALPYLKARGRTFVYSPYHLAQVKWDRLFPNWHPYGLNSLFYDHMPEDPDIYNVGAGLPRHLIQPDVLTGCTTWTGENPTNDMIKAAGRAADAVRLALDSGFFAEITTHEQKFAVLSLEELDRWLTRLVADVARYDVRLAGHEHCAELTRARDHTWIEGASGTSGGPLAVTLNGTAPVPQELAVFTHDGEDVVQRWHRVPPLNGAMQLAV